MTLEALAEAVGTTKANLSRIETGKQGYTQDGLEAIADALGTHTATLLTRGPVDEDQAAIPIRRARRR